MQRPNDFELTEIHHRSISDVLILARRSGFRPVNVVNRTPSVGGGTAAVIQMTAAGPRVEGLTVETAARLLTLLR